MDAAGLGYIVFEAQGSAVEGKGPIAKFIPADVQARILAKAGVQAGDAVFFAADKPAAAEKLAGAARTRIGDELGLDRQGRASSSAGSSISRCTNGTRRRRRSTSPTTRSRCRTWPIEEFLALDPADRDKILAIKAIQYDIVCNGIELSSGAIRNHRPDVMRKAFAIAGYGENALEQKFGGMLRALSLGAPPHGGIAPGIDRIVMLLCGEENLREVVLFPMNQRAEDLMMGAPSEVSPKQLRELHIRLNLPDKSI